MAIVFLVGDAADVFEPQFASSVTAELRRHFPAMSAAAVSGEEAYRSDEVDARGWAALQRRTAAMAPQVAQMEAYQAVWLPGGPVSITAIPVANAADPLHVGSVEQLVEELRAFAAAESLPTDDIELMQLAARYLEDDALFDQDLDIQMYVQLMLTARQAIARRQAVWVVV